jgi:hypothetical protein
MLFPLVPVLIWFVVLVLCRLPTQAPVRR